MTAIMLAIVSSSMLMPVEMKKIREKAIVNPFTINIMTMAIIQQRITMPMMMTRIPMTTV